MESILHIQRPKHSPYMRPTRSVSHTTALRKIVITDKYSIVIEALAKRQKLLRVISDAKLPIKKAKMLVNDVIVMEGPACFIASLILCAAGAFRSVWSTALQMTNMSSAPMPTNRNCIS